MELELFKDLDSKRLVQNVSHAVILSMFNHFRNVSLWLKQHVSLLIFVLKKEWCKFCIIFFDQATIIFKNYQRWTMEKRYKHIIFQNIIKTCWVVEVFDVLSVWFQYFVSNFSSIFTTTNLSKMNHNYFCIFDVLLLSALFFLGFQIMVLYQITILYQVLYVPNIWWCCTTHDVSGPNHGAGPHQYVELHSGYHHFPYGLLKTTKNL